MQFSFFQQFLTIICTPSIHLIFLTVNHPGCFTGICECKQTAFKLKTTTESVFSEAEWDGISKLLIVPSRSFYNMLLKYLSFVDTLFIYLHITCCSVDSYRQLSRFASLKPRPPLPNNWTRTNKQEKYMLSISPFLAANLLPGDTHCW